MPITEPIPCLRETAICPHCSLNQFVTVTGSCRRCGRPLGVEFVRIGLGECHERSVEEEFRSLATGIGAMIRSHRKQHGLSQRQLAQATHIGRSYLSRAENGRLIPLPSTLYRLAQFINLTAIIIRVEHAQAVNGSKRRQRI